jgi:hypothetical protein
VQGITSFAKQAAAALPLYGAGAADVSGVSARPLEQAEYMPRANLTMPAAPQTINPNLQPANIMPKNQYINPNLQPANISPIGGDARLPYQGYQAPLPLYLQNQQGFRFNNPYTYNNPFDIYGKRN